VTTAPPRDEARITVLMPLRHHHADYLRRSIGSVTGQTSRAWRLLVIVEESDLATFERLLARPLEDPGIALVVNRGRKLAGAINTGMRRADTVFVALLFADDMWSTDAVEVLTAHIAAHPDVDFFHSSRVVIDERDVAISPIGYSRDTWRLEDFPRGSPVKHLLCWRRDKALAIGGLDESLNSVGPDDYDFPWRMAESGAAFMAIRECLYYYRNHCDCYRLTTHLPRSVHEREVRRILKKHGVGLLRRLMITTRRGKGAVGEQCVYRSAIDKWIKDRLGYEARRGWTQITYR